MSLRIASGWLRSIEVKRVGRRRRKVASGSVVYAVVRLLGQFQLVTKDMRTKTAPARWLLAMMALGLAFSPASHADCHCEYINGVTQPMCGSSLDVRPTCGATVYLPERPTAYTERPVLAPLHPESCRPAVICNRHGLCRWRWVCD
ncbi:MAG TPA: hypothetical protein VGI22_19425 [Xanthobacteraceae bacterium]